MSPVQSDPAVLASNRAGKLTEAQANAMRQLAQRRYMLSAALIGLGALAALLAWSHQDSNPHALRGALIAGVLCLVPSIFIVRTALKYGRDATASPMGAEGPIQLFESRGRNSLNFIGVVGGIRFNVTRDQYQSVGPPR